MCSREANGDDGMTRPDVLCGVGSRSSTLVSTRIAQTTATTGIAIINHPAPPFSIRTVQALPGVSVSGTCGVADRVHRLSRDSGLFGC